MINFLTKFFVIALALLVFIQICQAASDSSIYLSPLSATYTVGSTFSVQVKINTAGVSVNAVEGIINFDPSKLKVLSISKADTVCTLWTQEPVFSNTNGSINFGGGNPQSFSGASVLIFSIRFSVLTSGTADLSFQSGSLLAADGRGTNILGELRGASYEFKSKGIAPLPAATPKGAPSAPIVFSKTHPEEDKWYSSSQPTLSWELSDDISSARTLLDNNSSSKPLKVYTPAIDELNMDLLDDGIWYFHLQLANSYGWGEIAHRALKIDTEMPELKIDLDQEGDPTNPRPLLNIIASDITSGIDHYEIKIGEGDRVRLESDDLTNNSYRLPYQAPGTYTVLVSTFDKAGNYALAADDFTIEPLAKPLVIDAPEVLNVGDFLMIKGHSDYLEGTVSVFVKKEGQEPVNQDVQIKEDGRWLFIFDKSLDQGVYKVWAQITDDRGAKSYETEALNVAALVPGVLRIGKLAIDYLSVTIVLLALTILLLLVILWGWRRIIFWKKDIRQETEEVQEELKQAFDKLSKEVKKQVSSFDKKKGLSAKEKRIRDKLQQALDKSEKIIGKELRDIEEKTKKGRRFNFKRLKL